MTRTSTRCLKTCAKQWRSEMTRAHMYVFYKGRMICIESNPGFALRYWKRRRALDNRITWTLRYDPEP